MATTRDEGTRLRLTPFVALLAGVTLLATGVLFTANALSQEQRQRQALDRDAEQVASSFTAYFERARSLDLVLARNQAFHRDEGAEGAVDRSSASSALAYLEVLYPDSIGEACVISQAGSEFARVTQGVAAGDDELSDDEATNQFFRPTLAVGADQVYQASPYVSPDTGQWVISNSTWVDDADGDRMVVHFEVDLASFGESVRTTDADRHVAVVDGDTGRVVMETGRALPTPLLGTVFPAGFATTDWSRDLAGQQDMHLDAIDGHPAALEEVEVSPTNANDWYVVEWSTASASLVPVGASLLVAAIGFVLLIVALASLRRQQVTLRRAARLDHLTGLANRKALEEAMAEALGAARATGERVAVLVADLDGFKQVNDTLGHEKGDLVLQEVARRLHANVFEYDTTARLGGDEFAVLVRNLHAREDVASVAHRLRDALIRPIQIDGVERLIGASIGAAVHPDHGTTPEDLLRNADAAMYRAKRDHEGVRVYDAGTAAGATALGLAAELLAAIDADDLELVYQPQCSLGTGEVVGVEALCRWHRTEHGPVPPVEFVALAEETGLIRSLTSLTLRHALDEAARWRAEGTAVPVSVNLSARVATDTSLPAEVWGLLDERGLDPSALVLEITETAVITDRAAAVGVLGALRAGGIRIELDDFGNGYSSFATLRDLPLDGVKIDRSLVIDDSDPERRLLAATVDNARHLGLTVVAEGIEDPDTLDLVRRLGCETAQGFHLGRPMDAASLRNLLGAAAPAPEG